MVKKISGASNQYVYNILKNPLTVIQAVNISIYAILLYNCTSLHLKILKNTSHLLVDDLHLKNY